MLINILIFSALWHKLEFCKLYLLNFFPRFPIHDVHHHQKTIIHHQVCFVVLHHPLRARDDAEDERP